MAIQHGSIVRAISLRLSCMNGAGNVTAPTVKLSSIEYSDTAGVQKLTIKSVGHILKREINQQCCIIQRQTELVVLIFGGLF